MTTDLVSPVGSLSVHNEDEAIEEFHERGWTDGLPIVVPTPERVDQMLAWSQGLDPDVVLGLMPPLLGEVTVAKVAVNAVMAGCRPEYFPTVLAAIGATLEPSFTIGSIQETTHPITPLLIVNGPVRMDQQIASGTGALGPGTRANATIGRALRLALINLGGGRIGVGDMATFGSPSKYSLCIAEDEENSPFEPLHVSRGLSPTDSAITAVPIEGPHLVCSIPDSKNPLESADRLLNALSECLANVGSTSVFLGHGAVAVLLNPDHAQLLASVGFDRAAVQAALWERAVQQRSVLSRYAPMLVAETSTEPGADVFHVVDSPDDIVVAVCGGAGLYSIAFPSWGVSSGAHLATTAKIRDPQVCEA